MRHTLGVLLFLLSLNACQRVGNDDTETAAAAEKEEKQLEAHEHTYDRRVLANPTRSNRFFRRAAENFLAGEVERSAVAIREGRGAWNEEVTTQNEEWVPEKVAMLDSLDQLAQRVEGGRIFAVDRLDALFSRAELLGAAIQLRNSQSYLSNQDHKSAVVEGQSGLTRLGQAETHVGGLIDRETHRLMKDVGTLLTKTEHPPRGIHPGVDTLGLKMDSIQVAIRTMTTRQDKVKDVDTAYQAVPEKP